MIRDLIDRYYRWRHAYALARGNPTLAAYYARLLHRE